MSNAVLASYLVPGLPHLVFGDSGWEALKAAYAQAAKNCQDKQPDVLVLYSAQWISVLGHSFQADPNPKGLHVDDNWYDMGDFPFSFHTDVSLTQAAEAETRADGFATKLVNYEGFPIDTGSLVALKYFNPDNKLPVVIVSSNIYCNQVDSYKLGQSLKRALDRSGKRVALINCSALSHRFLTTDIQPSEDHIASASDDEWNKKIIGLLEKGQYNDVIDQGEAYAKGANPEMMFKGHYWTMGAMGIPTKPANVLGYGPVWGTGAAVIEMCPN